MVDLVGSGVGSSGSLSRGSLSCGFIASGSLSGVVSNSKMVSDITPTLPTEMRPERFCRTCTLPLRLPFKTALGACLNRVKKRRIAFNRWKTITSPAHKNLLPSPCVVCAVFDRVVACGTWWQRLLPWDRGWQQPCRMSQMERHYLQNKVLHQSNTERGRRHSVAQWPFEL